MVLRNNIALNISDEGEVCSEQRVIWCLLFQDEECLRPGEATDLSFLEKLEEKVGDHAHFVTYAFTLCILSQRKLFPSLAHNSFGEGTIWIFFSIKQSPPPLSNVVVSYMGRI